MNSSDVAIALNQIYLEGLQSMIETPRPNVVNLSLNAAAGTGIDSSGVPEINWTKINGLVTPAILWSMPPIYTRHPGHVVVQSAGNFYRDACDTYNAGYGASYAYKTSFSAQGTSVDGVIVVGALNSSGLPVGGGNGTFSSNYPLFGDPPVGLPAPWAFAEAGSNYGSCVDMWAPGDFIYSTWGQGYRSTRDYASYGGGEPSLCAGGGCVSAPHSGWAFLSGTSMAAPHVAAAAAYVADLYSLTSPAAIEQHLRSNLKPSYGNDAAGQPARMVQLQ